MAEIWPMTVLKPSELKARTRAILDKAKQGPIYVERDGTLLVITKAKLVAAQDYPLLSRWELKAKAIESFYDPPRPGEVWWIDLGMRSKFRPMMVVSREDPNPERALSVCVPCTTTIK